MLIRQLTDQHDELFPIPLSLYYGNLIE